MPKLNSIVTPEFLYFGIGLVVLIGIIIFAIIFVNKKIEEKRKKECFNLLNTICDERINDKYTLELANNNVYDYYIETNNHRYYIKLINNPYNQEICVNNAIKWQLRRCVKEKEIRFVDGVEQLMRMDIKKGEKTAHKLYIIYPNCKALFKVINECEMIFVNPDTDIYGSNIITFKQLQEDHNLLEL